MSNFHLNKLIEEALDNAFENGYGPELMAMGDEGLAKDLISYDAELEQNYTYIQVLAAIRDMEIFETENK